MTISPILCHCPVRPAAFCVFDYSTVFWRWIAMRSGALMAFCFYKLRVIVWQNTRAIVAMQRVFCDHHPKRVCANERLNHVQRTGARFEGA